MITIAKREIQTVICGGVNCCCGYTDASFGSDIQTISVVVENEQNCINKCCSSGRNTAIGVIEWYSFSGKKKFCSLK